MGIDLFIPDCFLGLGYFYNKRRNMTKQDIICMAKEAELVAWLPNSNFSDGIWWIEAHEVGFELERFAALVVSAEREACAKVCETFDQREAFNDEDMAVADACANAIRARGQA